MDGSEMQGMEQPKPAAQRRQARKMATMTTSRRPIGLRDALQVLPGAAVKATAHHYERQQMKTTLGMKMAMIGLAILVSGCAPKSPYLPKEYDPTVSARLRIYFGPKTMVTLNYTCDEGARPYSFEANDPLVRGISNTVIGMPMPNTDDKYYSEYVVTAGIPIDIYSRGGGWSHPNSIGMSMHSSVFGDSITAVLEAGKDYETLYQHPKTVLRELVVVDGVVRTKPVAVKKSARCKNIKIDSTPLPKGENS